MVADFLGVVTILCTIAASLVLGFSIGYDAGIEQANKLCVERGAAKYDDKLHSCVWTPERLAK